MFLGERRLCASVAFSQTTPLPALSALNAVCCLTLETRNYMIMKYPPVPSDSDIVKEPAVTNYQQSISPADALWALYQSQTKKVRKAFRQRVLEEDRTMRPQQSLVKESLVKAFGELHSGEVKHDARSLFAEQS